MGDLDLSVRQQTLDTEVLAKNPVTITGTLSSAARDDGNTPTTTVRAGKPLGRITATGLLIENDATASDGSETFFGILAKDSKLLDENNAATNKVVGVIVGGELNQTPIAAVADANFSLANAKTENTGVTFRTPEALHFPGAIGI